VNTILGKSKTKQKILRLLFANEEKSFYLSEIAKIVGVSAGNAQRELNRLKRDGVVASQKKGNLRYYSLDKNNPAFPDIENIVKKTIGIELELSEIFSGLKGVKFAFVFGSYAKNELKSGSDIDIVVIGNLDENELSKKTNSAENEIGREINYHIYSLPEFKKRLREESFLKNVVKKYKILSGNKNEFRKILQ
jgi:predicted nucleotidyltransferase